MGTLDRGIVVTLTGCDRGDCSAETSCALYCLTCGYDLRGLGDSAPCPECGAARQRHSENPQSGIGAAICRALRLLVPGTSPITDFWIPNQGRRSFGKSRRRLATVAISLIPLALFGIAGSIEVHKVEWVLASSGPIEYEIIAQVDNWNRPRAADVRAGGERGISFSFKSKSTYGQPILGTIHVTRDERRSKGAGQILWPSTGSPRITLPPGLQLVKHVSQTKRTFPDRTRLPVCISLSIAFPILLGLGNMYLLPIILRLANPGGLDCRPGLRAGAARLTAILLLSLSAWIVVLSILTSSSGWTLFDRPSWNRAVGQLVFGVLFLLPVWLAARGIHMDRAQRMFPNRIVSVVAAGALQIFVFAAWFGMGVAAVEAMAAKTFGPLS